MTTSMGKKLRLARLFDPDSSTSIILPLDHGVKEPGYAELERRRSWWAASRGPGWTGP